MRSILVWGRVCIYIYMYIYVYIYIHIRTYKHTYRHIGMHALCLLAYIHHTSIHRYTGSLTDDTDIPANNTFQNHLLLRPTERQSGGKQFEKERATKRMNG